MVGGKFEAVGTWPKEGLQLKPKTKHYIIYQDAVSTLTTRATDRMHRAGFILKDSKGLKIKLESSRLGIADSHVFVKVVEPGAFGDFQHQHILFNYWLPGGIYIDADGFGD